LLKGKVSRQSTPQQIVSLQLETLNAIQQLVSVQSSLLQVEQQRLEVETERLALEKERLAAARSQCIVVPPPDGGLQWSYQVVPEC
jgi:hypothetical protein